MEAEMLKDLVYRADHEKGRLDVILPQGTPGPWPVVICIHGGAWREGSKDAMRLYGSLLAGMGVAAVLPNYRLTVTHPHPAQEEDVFAVLQWVADHRDVYGFDVDRVGLTGSSAGAHLAALVGMKATREGYEGPCNIRCILAVCGVHDFILRAKDQLNHPENVNAFLGGPIEERLDVAREASPTTHVHAKAPVVRCVHGRLDTIVSITQSEALVAALQRVGVKSELCVAPDDGHAMTAGGAGIEPLGGRDAFVEFFTSNLLHIST